MMSSMIKKYIKFINSLDCKKCNKIIIPVYPTVLKDKNVFNSLLNYGILSNNDIKSIKKIDIKKHQNLVLDIICIKNLIIYLKNIVKFII